MRFEVDHDAAALHALGRHVVDRQRGRAEMPAGALDNLSIAVFDRSGDMFAGTVAIIEDDLRRAVAISVEQLADMREAVPLRRILQCHQHLVVADDVDEARVVAAERIDHVGHAVALGRRQLGRIAARIDDRAAGIIQRHRQAEGAALFHLGDGLQHLV